MARHFISKKEMKDLNRKLASLGLEISTSSRVEVEEIKSEKCFYVDGKPYVYEKESIIPILFLLNDTKPSASYVTVDDGAVPHILNGANVFAQGIIDMDPAIKEGDMVYIRNKDNVFIAVGIAERDSEEVMRDKKGEAIRLIHYPNDRIFKAFYK